MLKSLSRLLIVCTALTPVSLAAEQVNVYSARKEALIKPILDRFTQQTDIKVNLVTGKADALITRVASEGKLSPADILVTTDVGRLVRAKQQGLTQPIASDVAKEVVNEKMRDEKGHWFALTLRARPLMYAPDRVDPSKIKQIEDVADPQWRGRICVRSSSNIYNQSMVAAMLEQKGEEATLQWAKGLVKNFARPPKGGDRDQIKAVAAGQCDIAIANTYYLGGMLESSDENEVNAAKKVKVLWPNQSDRGAHINISGAAVMKHAPNQKNAIKLLEFMLQKDAQEWYATTNHEYPVRADVETSDVLAAFGDFKAESIALNKVGELNARAVKIMDRAGWK